MKRLEKIEIIERLNDPVYRYFRRLTSSIKDKCGTNLYEVMVVGVVHQLCIFTEFVCDEAWHSIEKAQMRNTREI